MGVSTVSFLINGSEIVVKRTAPGGFMNRLNAVGAHEIYFNSYKVSASDEGICDATVSSKFANEPAGHKYIFCDNEGSCYKIYINKGAWSSDEITLVFNDTRYVKPLKHK